ncbi:MAG: secretin N-terminal domain-containing protein [Acidobacteriota bacterium]|jgi:hypothetical protein
MKYLRYGSVLLLLLLPALLIAKTSDTLTWSMKHRDVASVLPRLAEDLGASGKLDVDFKQNTLTVTDRPSNIAHLRKLLEELDAPLRRFAVETRLEVLNSRRGHAILRPGAGYFDATQWLINSKPEQVYSSVVDLHEGESSHALLGKTFEVRLKAQGYDPTTKRLAFSELALVSKQPGGDRVLFSGAAALPEGKQTVLLATSGQLEEGYRLELRPLLLPVVTSREVP